MVMCVCVYSIANDSPYICTTHYVLVIYNIDNLKKNIVVVLSQHTIFYLLYNLFYFKHRPGVIYVK